MYRGLPVDPELSEMMMLIECRSLPFFDFIQRTRMRTPLSFVSHEVLLSANNVVQSL